MSNITTELINQLKKLSNPQKAEHSKRFFKSGKGEYAEGDRFLGITVPLQRKIAKQFYKELNLIDYETLLKNPFHEVRLTALYALVYLYEKSKDRVRKEEIKNFYLDNTTYVNNWDLVDSTAHKILGDFLLDKKDRTVLYKLAKSENIWEQRISIISTYRFIKDSQFDDTIAISELLLEHEHDLIHKAVGWMLREVGKKNIEVLKNFLNKHYKTMPRTMLRYAIEKFDKHKRKQYLQK